MKIYTTVLSFTGESSIHACDTIELDGKLWLVPRWLSNLVEGTRTPLRIICMDGLSYQKMPPNFQEDFVLNNPIPKCVLDGEVPDDTTFEFVIVESPDIVCDIPKRFDS